MKNPFRKTAPVAKEPTPEELDNLHEVEKRARLSAWLDATEDERDLNKAVASLYETYGRENVTVLEREPSRLLIEAKQEYAEGILITQYELRRKPK